MNIGRKGIEKWPGKVMEFSKDPGFKEKRMGKK